MTRLSLKTEFTTNDLVVNNGSADNANNGDKLRNAFGKLIKSIDRAEANFVELYANQGGGSNTGDLVFDGRAVYNPTNGGVNIWDGALDGPFHGEILLDINGITLATNNESKIWQLDNTGKLTFPDSLTVVDGIIGKSSTDTDVVEDVGGTTTSTTTVESQIEIETTGIVIAKRTIATVDDGVVSATNESGATLTVDNLGVVMKRYEEPEGPTNSAYFQIGTTNAGAVIEGVEENVSGTAHGRVTVTQGQVQVSTSNNNLSSNEWQFDNEGTLNVPVTFPRSFTALLDTEHMSFPDPSVAIDGILWQMDVTFNILDGELITEVEQIFPIVGNPGYVSGYTFSFTEADHGITGYTFDLELQDVVLAGPAGWTAGVAVSAPPNLPDSIKSSQTLALHGDAGVVISNGTGIHEEQFKFIGRNLILPGNGDIRDYLGNSVLGGGFTLPPNTTFDDLYEDGGATIYNTGGAIELYSNVAEGNDAVRVRVKGIGGDNTFTFKSNGTLTLPNSAALQAGNDVAISVGNIITTLHAIYIDAETVFGLVRDEDAQEFAGGPDQRAWDGLPSYEAYPLIIAYDGAYPPPSIVAQTANTAQQAYQAWQEEVAATKFSVNVMDKTLTFTSDGSLLLGTDFGAIYANQSTGQVSIGDYLGPNGAPVMPSTVVSIGGEEAFVISRGNGTNNPGWIFGDDGNLQLPAGGDIVDSNGDSVLGGGVTGGTGVLQLQPIPATKYGTAGDAKGMVAIDSATGDFYFCITDYTDGLTSIWRKTSGSDAW